jgi:thiol-disulfide isomerase/thioredoxin
MSYLTKSPVAKSITTLALSFLSLGVLIGQNMFHVMIQKPASTKSKDFLITYDDGLIKRTVSDTFNIDQLKFSGKYYSKFMVLNISYTGKDLVTWYDEYFIGTKPATITISSEDDMLVNKNFHNIKLLNAYEIYQSKFSKQRSEFSRNEINNMNEFWNRNHDSLWKKDSLKTIFNDKLNNLNRKDIEFIQKNGSDYFSFWWFKTQIVPNTTRNEDATVSEYKNLLSIYNTTFPYTYRSSVEGKRIKQLLSGKIEAQKNRSAPNFATKDMLGKQIRLSDFKGKYVLLDFWATWCGPCMKELPFIKKIRADFPPDKLAIIGISSDVDYKYFSRIVKEKEMDWIQVFGDQSVSEIFGVSAIPRTFLIDKNGIIIFDGKKEGNDELIKLLKSM